MKCNAYEYLYMRRIALILETLNPFLYAKRMKLIDLHLDNAAKQKLNVTLRKGNLILVTDKREEFYHKLNNINKGIK